MAVGCVTVWAQLSHYVNC